MSPNGAGSFFPTNPDLATILGRTDLDFDNFHLFYFFVESQNLASHAGLGSGLGLAWPWPGLGRGLGLGFFCSFSLVVNGCYFPGLGSLLLSTIGVETGIFLDIGNIQKSDL